MVMYVHISPRKGGGGSGRSTSASVGKSTSTSTTSFAATTSSTANKGSSSGNQSSSTRASSIPVKSTISIGSPASRITAATVYGNGGGKALAIPNGQLFSGRMAGGATRGQVYGTRMYGSGYPGYYDPGVAGRGFPFWFWPVVWGGTATDPRRKYLYNTEYGDPSNTSRPGGPMVGATFISNSTGTTFHVLSDNSTVASLISAVETNCSSNSTSRSPSRFNASAPGSPQPEQAIQYYRSSSIVLTLDGYNNSATFSNSPNTTRDSPLPSGIDTTLLNCLNYTIGQAAPLVGSASMQFTSSSCLGFVSFIWILWLLSRYA